MLLKSIEKVKFITIPEEFENKPEENVELTASQLILKYLELEGSNVIFGIPGGALANFITELMAQRDKFEYIITRHEAGASYMADGFFRTTGKMGVVAVTSGPGATNAVTGAISAQSSNSAVLTITGEVDSKYFGKNYLQEGTEIKLNVNRMFLNACEHSVMVTHPENVQTLVQQSLRECLSVPRRATHISLPNDIGGATLDANTQIPQSSENYRTEAASVNYKKVKDTLKRLTSAKQPLFFIGNGCRAALQDRERLAKFEAFVERFGIPVMTTPQAKGIFRENHPLSFRNYGLAKCQWAPYYMNPQQHPLPTEAKQNLEVCDQHDFLLVMGSSLGDYTTDKYHPILLPSQDFIQVDLDHTAIARAFPVEYGVVSEAAAFIDLMVELADDFDVDEQSKAERLAFIDNIKTHVSPYRDAEKMNDFSSPVLPQALMGQLNDLIPEHSHLFVDVGNIMGWSLHYLQINSPNKQIHYSLNMAPMGFGTAAAIGGKMGAPDKTCVCLTGDGAFMMHGNEISTAAQYKTGVVYVVLDDNDLSMVSQGQEYFFGPRDNNEKDWRHYYKVGQPDLVDFASGLGADAYRVDTIEGVQELLPLCIEKANNEGKPQVLVVKINTFEMPPYYSPRKRVQ